MGIHDNFVVFHNANPKVYWELVRLAKEAKTNGHQKIGIGMLWEVMRWNLFYQKNDPNSEFKLNNNYRSRYARFVMDTNPDLVGLFETRELKSP